MPSELTEWVGHQFPEHSLTVTQKMIDAFADVIDAPTGGNAPLSFPMRIDMNGPHARNRLETLGIPIGSVLHAEQRFQEIRAITAGMTVTCSTSVRDVAVKKQGTLVLVTFQTGFAENQRPLGEMQFTIAVRRADA